MRIFILLSLLLPGPPLPAQSGINWSQTAAIAASHFGNMHPRVVADGSENPVVIWGNATAKRGYFARWTGNGFSSPLNLNPDTIPVFAASWAGQDLAAQGDTVYVVYKETLEHPLRVSPNPVGGNELSLRLEGAESQAVRYLTGGSTFQFQNAPE